MVAGKELYRKHGMVVNWDLAVDKKSVRNIDWLVGEYYSDYRKVLAPN